MIILHSDSTKAFLTRSPDWPCEKQKNDLRETAKQLLAERIWPRGVMQYGPKMCEKHLTPFLFLFCLGIRLRVYGKVTSLTSTAWIPTWIINKASSIRKCHFRKQVFFRQMQGQASGESLTALTFCTSHSEKEKKVPLYPLPQCY